MDRESLASNWQDQAWHEKKGPAHTLYNGRRDTTRTQRTYVNTECPYIKVNVRFKVVNGENLTLTEDADIIESISQPYLAWGVKD